MVHEPSEKGCPDTPRRPVPGILLPVSAFMAALSRKARHVSKKLPRHHNNKTNRMPSGGVEPVKPPRSTTRKPVPRRPKELITSVSNKVIRLIRDRKKDGAVAEPEEEEDFGDGGVWQKAILMGGRCQPLNFSGMIYYDENGRKLDHLPSHRTKPYDGISGH
ncbi:hypothetical protein SAY86_016322 [Trapa natans]|uniref:Uncharacterized protein n=1 Tax=Trapa natans TaxID=22666 RepID=A0AAN7LC25_TRANT|nr:hypothetical protein SAY86_016322 [Trapa natans]